MHSTILKNDKYQLLKIIKTKRVLKCLLYFTNYINSLFQKYPFDILDFDFPLHTSIMQLFDIPTFLAASLYPLNVLIIFPSLLI
jgi:hypothetical protein